MMAAKIVDMNGAEQACSYRQVAGMPLFFKPLKDC